MGKEFYNLTNEELCDLMCGKPEEDVYDDMKYVIMCGGRYDPLGKYPSKHFIEVNGEALVARTIRLLRECEVEDISISSDNEMFEQFGVPVIKPNSEWVAWPQEGYWADGFIDTGKPTCYLFGDVLFSKKAIQTIVDTQTLSIEFFASAPPFALDYRKHYAEPFAFKVWNTKHFFEAVEDVKRLQDEGYFNRFPIAWELWQVIKHTPLNKISYDNYIAINDYTCDIDCEEEMLAVASLIDKYGFTLED